MKSINDIIQRTTVTQEEFDCRLKNYNEKLNQIVESLETNTTWIESILEKQIIGKVQDISNRRQDNTIEFIVGRVSDSSGRLKTMNYDDCFVPENDSYISYNEPYLNIFLDTIFNPFDNKTHKPYAENKQRFKWSEDEHPSPYYSSKYKEQFELEILKTKMDGMRKSLTTLQNKYGFAINDKKPIPLTDVINQKALDCVKTILNKAGSRDLKIELSPEEYYGDFDYSTAIKVSMLIPAV